MKQKKEEDRQKRVMCDWSTPVIQEVKIKDTEGITGDAGTDGIKAS